MLDYIYQLTLKLFQNTLLGVEMSRFCLIREEIMSEHHFIQLPKHMNVKIFWENMVILPSESIIDI